MGGTASEPGRGLDKGAQATNSDDVTVKDVYVFSREIAREAKGNAVAVTARHKGRNYALRGDVDYIQEDGADYNVSFAVPDQADVQLRAPGDREPRVGVACLCPQSVQTAMVTGDGGSASHDGILPPEQVPLRQEHCRDEAHFLDLTSPMAVTDAQGRVLPQWLESSIRVAA